MDFLRNLTKRMQDTQQRVSIFTIATLLILFLLPGIGWYLVYALWIVNAVWSFRQTQDSGIRIVHGVIGVALLLWLIISLVSVFSGSAVQ